MCNREEQDSWVSDTFHITHSHFDIEILISAALICHLSVCCAYSTSHLFIHSVAIVVVNGVLYDDSIGFIGRVPQQGYRGDSHICKSHILRGIKWF